MYCCSYLWHEASRADSAELFVIFSCIEIFVVSHVNCSSSRSYNVWGRVLCLLIKYSSVQTVLFASRLSTPIRNKSKATTPTPCLKKTVQICICQNFVKFPPILMIFDRKMAKKLKLWEVHSFSTSSNLCHNTTVWNADVPNCHTTLQKLWK